MLNISNLFNSLTSLSNNIFIGSLGEDIVEIIRNFGLKIVLGIIKVCFFLVEQLMNVIFDLTYIDLFTDAQIQEVSKRIYMILGVIVLFKVIISCVQYLINPDKSSDKEGGFGSILKRVLITLGLLALMPSIFVFAKSAQLAICETLPRLILGIDNMETAASDRETTTKNIIKYTAYSFFDINDDCGYSDATVESENIAFRHAHDSFDKIWDDQDNILTTTCLSNPRVYKYKLHVLVGIGVSGFLVFIVGSLSLEVAIRLLKFSFLEFVSPVAIASYVDPKSSKKMFDSWVKTTVSVYLDLFIRLGVIYLIVFLFKELIGGGLFDSSYKLNNGDIISGGRVWVLRIFIILGMFMFAKEFPKFLSDALGLKAAGDIGKMFKRAGGFAGAGLGALKTAGSNYVTQLERFKQQGKRGAALRAALSAAAGAGSATARGMKMATIDGKGFGDARKNSYKNAIAARNRRMDLQDNVFNDDFTRGDYYRSRMRDFMGIPSSDQFIKTRYDQLDQAAKDAAAAKGHGATKMHETPDRFKISLDRSKPNQSIVIDALGYEELTMEQANNIYKMAQNNGGKVKNSAGVEIELTNDQLAALGSTVQDVEKRTSYLKEAELTGLDDPAAATSFHKMLNNLKANKTGYSADEIFRPIQDAMAADHITVTSIDDVIDILEHQYGVPLQHKMPDRSRYPDDASYQNAYQEWRDEVDHRANILLAMKDAFENSSRENFNAAQLADLRIKKSQQAAKNDKKS